jgi:H+/Cl- antiporter ClcA
MHAWRRPARCLRQRARLRPPPLQFSALGLGCAGAAVALYEGVRVSEIFLRPLPRYVSAPLGGALCGLIAFWHPQVRLGDARCAARPLQPRRCAGLHAACARVLRRPWHPCR